MSDPALSFFTRLAMAFVCFFRILFNLNFARKVRPVYRGLEPRARPVAPASSFDADEESSARLLPSQPRVAPPPPVASVAAAIPTPVVARLPEQEHASGLFVLSMLQREGRLIDFLQEEIAAYSDAEVGGAARVVHEGCRKVVRQYLALEPVLKDVEGASVNVPQGFDAQRIRLTGNVAGHPPFVGSLKHHGWTAVSIKLPAIPTAVDPRILAPAEVELS